MSNILAIIIKVVTTFIYLSTFTVEYMMIPVGVFMFPVFAVVYHYIAKLTKSDVSILAFAIGFILVYFFWSELSAIAGLVTFVTGYACRYGKVNTVVTTVLELVAFYGVFAITSDAVWVTYGIIDIVVTIVALVTIAVYKGIK